MDTGRFDFDLEKQLRIAARNRRVGKRLTEQARLRKRNLIGAVSVALAVVYSLLVFLAFGFLK